MKQQISELINGCKNVVRKEDDPKYLNANSATSHVGYSGTNTADREITAATVAQENPDSMNVEIKGRTLTLSHGQSKSGKTWWWSAAIDEELAGLFLAPAGNFRHYTLTVNSDCTVQIDRFVRRTEKSQWRHSWCQLIDESFIKIL